MYPPENQKGGELPKGGGAGRLTSEERPGEVQEEGRAQSRGGVAPPGQYLPTPHTVPPGEVDPAAQAYPGAALQAPLQEALAEEEEEEKVPPLHTPDTLPLKAVEEGG